MADNASRYARRPTLLVTMPDGSTRTMSAPRVAPPVPSAGRREVAPGERLDLLAGALLGDTTQWWRIADANPFPDAVRLESPGQTIELPGR